jgi:NAD(P)-dependent dehydrogenase (short-subunit alcohol dehydrogenase family)
VSAVDLNGRVVIVTGAGKGLGKAYALALARAGAAVIVNNRRHPGEDDRATSAMQTVGEITTAGGRAAANWDDVCDPQSGARMVRQALDQFGGLDGVVANAAVGTPTPMSRTTLDEFRAVFDPGFFGNLHLVHAAWPHMRAVKHGRIVLTASSAGLYGVHGMAAYSASKAAVIGLMRALALEGRSSGIGVNVVAPYGYSQMTAPWMSQEQAKRFDPAYVAPLIACLVSAACTVSGEVLVSGGGGVRRAGVKESDTVMLGSSAPAAPLDGLGSTLPNSYGDANAAFAEFMASLDGSAKAG